MSFKVRQLYQFEWRHWIQCFHFPRNTCINFQFCIDRLAMRWNQWSQSIAIARMRFFYIYKGVSNQTLVFSIFTWEVEVSEKEKSKWCVSILLLGNFHILRFSRFIVSLFCCCILAAIHCLLALFLLSGYQVRREIWIFWCEWHLSSWLITLIYNVTRLYRQMPWKWGINVSRMELLRLIRKMRANSFTAWIGLFIWEIA